MSRRREEVPRDGREGPREEPRHDALAEEAPEAPDVLERRWRPYRALVDAERLLCCALLLAVLAAVTAQVVTRYALGTPLSWTEELARFLLVWLTFTAAGYVASRRLHIAVDLLAHRLGRRAGSALDAFAALVTIAAAGVLAVAGALFAASASGLLAPATRLPVTVVYAAAVAGFGLVVVHGLLNLLVVRRHPEEVPDPVEALAPGTGRRP